MIATAAAAMSVMFAHPSDAQVNERIKPFVADARITWVRFKEDGGIASAIGVTPDNLPTRGLGFVLGAHWYPLRGSQVALGIGGEFLRAEDTRTLDPATEDAEEGPTVETSLFSLAPQVSLNFGKKDGWSYISGGIGSAIFTAERMIDLSATDRASARSTTVAEPAGSPTSTWRSRWTCASTASARSQPH